jgi:hypothetical protein
MQVRIHMAVLTLWPKSVYNMFVLSPSSASQYFSTSKYKQIELLLLIYFHSFALSLAPDNIVWLFSHQEAQLYSCLNWSRHIWDSPSSNLSVFFFVHRNLQADTLKLSFSPETWQCFFLDVLGEDLKPQLGLLTTHLQRTIHIGPH